MRWKNCREILGIVDNNPELKPSDEFKNFYIKFSVIRLGIMVFLLLLAIAEIINISDRGMRLEINRDLQYILIFCQWFFIKYHISPGCKAIYWFFSPVQASAFC